MFFQGGPGSEAPRLLKLVSETWWDRALKDYRLLLLDQRGTGRSTPVGPLPGMSREEQAEYLTHFRADSIVRDAEAIRPELGVESWSVLGQSFGGFCVVYYLSQAPEGLAEAFVTGGLPPLDRHPDDVYRATYERARAKNARLLRAISRRPRPCPRDRRTARGRRRPAPDGDRLTVRRFRQLGNMLGMSYGFEQLHYILELPFGSPAFLHDVQAPMPFARNPIYAVIHEACYAPGVATRWSAERVFPDDLRDDPTFLTGEHIYPWMFEDYGAFGRSPRPPRSSRSTSGPTSTTPSGWPRTRFLQRPRSTPRTCTSSASSPKRPPPASAAYVPWVTNEYEHDGLRSNGEAVLGRLFDLVQGRA